MTAFERIISAIEGFGYPYEPDVYTGSELRYFVYNYADERGYLYADNTPTGVIASVQVHFFLPAKEDFIEIKNQIREALFRKGFTFPDVTVLKEGKKRHIVFECDIEEEMED